MHYLYLLELKNGSIYTGICKNIKRRFSEHENGSVLATKGKRPIKLLFYCAFPNKKLAAKFERYLKSGSGQAFRNKHFL
jgi:putative endonuclease